MSERVEKNKILIRKNPHLTGNQLYLLARKEGYGIKKQTFYEVYRDLTSLGFTKSSTPDQVAKREKLERIVAQRKISKKLPGIKPKSKSNTFDSIKKDLMKRHGISEKQAIGRARGLLKVRKIDYKRLDKVDRDVLTSYGY